jgi:hypothetical protein
MLAAVAIKAYHLIFRYLCTRWFILFGNAFFNLLSTSSQSRLLRNTVMKSSILRPLPSHQWHVKKTLRNYSFQTSLWLETTPSAHRRARHFTSTFILFFSFGFSFFDVCSSASNWLHINRFPPSRAIILSFYFDAASWFLSLENFIFNSIKCLLKADRSSFWARTNVLLDRQSLNVRRGSVNDQNRRWNLSNFYFSILSSPHSQTYRAAFQNCRNLKA